MSKQTHRAEQVPPGTDAEVPTPTGHEAPPMPGEVTKLSPGHLACGGCGIAVPTQPGSEPDVVEAVRVEGRAAFPPDPRTGEPRVMMRTPVTTCGACADRQERARRLVADHPALAGRFGPDGAEHRLHLVLDALAVVGVPLERLVPRPDDRTLATMIRLLAVEGGAARWRARFGPVADAEADPGTCAATPFGHVGDEHRTTLRQAVARVLAERSARTAPPVHLAPPPPTDASSGTVVDGGCLLCGTARVVLPAADVQRLGGRDRAAAERWHPLTASTAALGGWHSAEPLVGFVCPLCDAALREAGSIGTDAMEKSLRAYLTQAGRTDEAAQVVEQETSGLVAWGALVARQRARGRAESPANEEPWGHVRVVRQ